MGVSLEVWRSYNRACRNTMSLNIFANHVQDSATGIAMSLLLINILLYMGCVEANPGPAFDARCPICNYKLESLASYINHMVIGHSTSSSIPCYRCGESFKTSAAFRTHHDRFHSVNILKNQLREPAAHVVELLSNDHKFVCSEGTCVETLRTARALRRHMVDHLRDGYVILCPFQPCDVRFTKVNTFRVHCSQRHRVLQVHGQSPEFQAQHEVPEIQPQRPALDGQPAVHPDPEVQAPVENEDLWCDDFVNLSESDSDCDSEVGEDEDNYVECESWEHPDSESGYRDIFPGNMIRDRIGKFYLMLEGILLLPTNTVQKLSEEITHLLDMSHNRIRVAMKEELLKEGISSQKAQEIIDKALKKDTVYATHHKGMDPTYFGTDHLRKKFFKDKFCMLSPEEISLGKDDGGKQKYAHYIRIEDTLELLFNDPSVQEEIDNSFSRNRTRTPGVYTDIGDGSLHKNHPICSNMDCIELILYQDAFDFFPISPSSGIYKCTGFYFTLGNIDPKRRSKIDAIQLALLVKERDLKYFTPDVVLERLVSELVQLSTTGIQYKNRNLPVVVTQVCGDNLGQNFLGKYIECFTFDHYCRFCKITRKDILNQPDFVSPFRTPEEYDQLADQFDPQRPLEHKEGLRGHSVLNRVPFYHVSNPGQPPCIAHDILEGVGKEDVALYLKYLIEVKKWFSLDTLNRRIADFKPQERDSRDSLVKLDSSLSKIKGHASEVWLFIRVLPFLIGDLIPDKDDKVWQLCLKLKIICEYVFSPKISVKQVAKLKGLISLYVEIRAALFTKNLLPKHHFMCHYAELIAMCGNLIRLWTMRFESRHIFFKRAGEVASNFKNITHTLVSKYVHNFAFKMTTPLFSGPISFRGEDAHALYPYELKPEVQDLLKSDLTFTRSLTSVSVYGITYAPGLWVILGCHGKDLVVGEILLMLYNGGELKFIVKSHEAHNSFQGYYKIHQEGGTMSAVMQNSLEDYYPLPAYHFQDNLCISLKHSFPAMD